ncbi:hypothetical protein PBSP11RLL_000509200, partial [Plasmodium berghei]
MSKGYIKIIFSLLISSVYMSNKTFAAEANSDIEALRKFARPPNIRSIFPNDYSEGAIEEQSFNSCVYPQEIEIAEKYNYIISILWNSNAKYVGGQIVKEKVARAYSPNLMMIQQRYKNDAISFHGYYYALAKKVQVSDDTTIIVYASSDVNDYNSVNKKKYTNTILESANSFKPKIYSEKDIRNGELTRMFVNLSGFIIQKKGIALILPISTL